MSEWRDVTVAEVAQKITKGTTPAGAAFSKQGPRYIKVESITVNGQIDLARVTRVDEGTHRGVLARSILEQDDVLFTIAGTIGRTAIVGSEILPANTNQAVAIIRPNRSLVLPRFLFYAMRQKDRVRLASSRTVQSVQSNLSLRELSGIRLQLPPLPEQQAIAEVLGALDDKIAANTKLAAIADHLVRMDYSSLDPSNTVRIGDVAVSPRDAISPDAIDPDTLYVGLEHMPRRLMWLCEFGTAADVTSTKSRFQPGDVLFGKLRPYFHKVVSASSSGICSTDVLVVRACDSGDVSVLLAALSSDEVITAVTAASEGTRMPRTSWRDLAAIPVPWPTNDERAELERRLSAVRQATLAALAENRTLAATRDALLPHLMSGKLRVRDAEAALSAVGV